MNHKIQVELNEAQFRAATAHAEKKDRKIGEDIAIVWWGRLKALADYAEKVKGPKEKFRPYAPRLIDAKDRAHVKDLAVHKGVGVAPVPPREPKPRKAKKPKATKKTTPKATKKAPSARKPAKAAPLAPSEQAKALKRAEASIKDAGMKATLERLAKASEGLGKAKKVKAPKEAPIRQIDLYDSDAVALAKARLVHEKGGRSVADILKDVGRDEHGKLLPKEAAK